MGINSVGHRLTILKSVYDVKKAQDIPIESDHYVPLCMISWFTVWPRAADIPELTLPPYSRRCRSPVRDSHLEGYQAPG